MGAKEYLITDIFKNDLKIKKNYYFVDEFSKRYYEKDKQNNNINYLFSINSYSKINHTSKFVLKKVSNYRDQLAIKFNQIHNKTYSKRYWGLILDQFLFLIINSIYIETKIFKKIFAKKKKIIVNKEFFAKTYIDTDDFISSRINDNSQAYSRFVIAEKLGFKTKKFLKAKSENLKPIIKNNFILLGLRKLVQLYIKTFNPIVLIDCYFGKINSFKIFINSFGKILSVNSSIFFNEKPPKLKKDEVKRKKLLVVEKDHFDEIFNKLFKKFLPSSYLENYSHYEKFNKSFKNIKKIGSAVSIIYNDQFKLLSAKILEHKGKLYVFPHGGLLGQNKDDYDQIVEKKYATKVFRHYDKAPIEQNQYTNLISYNLNNIKKNNQILFYPTSMLIKSNYKIPLLKKYHPYCNFFYELYDNLSLQLKAKVRLKTFPHFISKYFERNWIKIYKKNFFEKKNKYLFNKSKIVIIDDYSTPLCELLYTDTPFMILDPEKKNLKPEILKKILKLKKLNILFENPKKASNFLNKNYDKLDKWWSKILKNKNYLDLKKNLISENKKKINLEKALN